MQFLLDNTMYVRTSRVKPDVYVRIVKLRGQLNAADDTMVPAIVLGPASPVLSMVIAIVLRLAS